MSQAAIVAAFDAQLKTFAGGGDVTVEGQVYRPRQGVPFLSGRLAAYTRVPLGPGADCVIQESGAYAITIHRPGREQRTVAGAVADELVALFPRGMVLMAGTQFVSIQVTIPQQAIAAGDWLTLPVMVSWIASDP